MPKKQKRAGSLALRLPFVEIAKPLVTREAIMAHSANHAKPQIIMDLAPLLLVVYVKRKKRRGEHASPQRAHPVRIWIGAGPFLVRCYLQAAIQRNRNALRPWRYLLKKLARILEGFREGLHDAFQIGNPSLQFQRVELVVARFGHFALFYYFQLHPTERTG